MSQVHSVRVVTLHLLFPAFKSTIKHLSNGKDGRFCHLSCLYIVHLETATTFWYFPPCFFKPAETQVSPCLAGPVQCSSMWLPACWVVFLVSLSPKLQVVGIPMDYYWFGIFFLSFPLHPPTSSSSLCTTIKRWQYLLINHVSILSAEVYMGVSKKKLNVLCHFYLKRQKVVSHIHF